MKKKAYRKDILRTISRGKRRFFSILFITVLGVVMFTGLQAGCEDLRLSADAFFDEQNLYDIAIQSTLGLTDDDVEALAGLDGIEAAEGGYSETVNLSGDSHKSVEIRTIGTSGMNAPYVVEGTLPEAADEIAVTQSYLNDSGKSIGDTVEIEEILEEDSEEDGEAEEDSEEEDSITIDVDIDPSSLEEEEETPSFPNTEYTITAVVIDPANINNTEGSTSFRDTSTTDYTFFVAPEAVDSDIYTVVYLVVSGAADLNCYSDEYDDAVSDVIDSIESELKSQREAARTEEVKDEAQEQIDDAEEIMNDAFEEADRQIADAEEELADGRTELDDGWEEYYDGLEELEDGQEELDEGTLTLMEEQEDAEAEIEEAWAELEDSSAQLEEAWAELEENEALLTESQAELDAGAAELSETQAETEAQLEEGKAALEAAQAELEETISSLEAQAAAAESQLGSAWPAEAFEALRTAAASGGDTSEAEAALSSALEASLSPTLEALQSQIDSLNSQLTVSETAQTVSASGTSAGSDAAAEESTEESTEDAGSDESAAMEENTEDSSSEDSGSSEENTDPGAESGSSTGSSSEIQAQMETLQAQMDALNTLMSSLPQLAIGLGQADAGLAEIESESAALAQQEAEAEAQFAAAWETLNSSQAELDAGLAELEEGRAQLEEAQAELDAGEETLLEQEALAEEEFAEAWDTIEESQAELDEGLEELNEGRTELEDGEEEYADGLAELEEGKETYEEERADAEAQLADAQAELDDLEDAQWYVQDRSGLSGYVNVESDSGSIESIGNAFAVIFLAVAILISLTTITRMVEEDRGLIGTYKALGFTGSEVLMKYMIYALSACLLGGILGDIGGFVLLPEILFIVFQALYVFPAYSLSFTWSYGLLGPAIFLIGVAIATLLACYSEMKQTPAILMRPKSPKPGSKVFLEHIPFIWKHLSFLNKVTARNLFRYKKRLFMTVVGILGCTALLVCGFAIKDSVDDLSPRQYEEVYSYDILAVASDNEEMLEALDSSEEVESYLNIRIDSVTVEYGDGSETIQLYVIPDEDLDELGAYLNLESTTTGESLLPDESGVLITRNAGQILGFSAGDTVLLQDLTLTEGEATVTALIQNYLGNGVYMTQSFYESLFGEYEANSVLANLNDSCEDPIAWAEELSLEDGLTSVTATQQLKNEMNSAFALINMVVYLIIIMAAALAFVVLYTLSTTNISERERELATIKVLGFNNREVHLYVNKETIILTILGILPGLVVGNLFGHALTSVLNMPSLYFAVSIHPVSYLYSGGLALIFALLVQLITDRVLDRINPAEALKSIE